MLTRERKDSTVHGNQRRSSRTAEISLPIRRRSSAAGASKTGRAASRTSRTSMSSGGMDLSADLTELRAKYEQRRTSEHEQESTILTATQIASMLEGDDVDQAAGNNKSSTSKRAAEARKRELSIALLGELQQPQSFGERVSAALHAYWRPVRQWWTRFVSRGYMIEAFSLPVVTWDIILSAAALYNAVYVPLALAMPGARWSDDGTDALFGYLLDGIFVLDVFLRFRVSYRDHGYPVFDKQRVATRYLRGWLLPDALSSIPLDAIFVNQPALALLKTGRMLRWRNLRKLDRIAVPRGYESFRYYSTHALSRSHTPTHLLTTNNSRSLSLTSQVELAFLLSPIISV